ncbi:BTB/POZ protein [Glomus cerebriforme]|uniref:BTB/POZ protein n=1 Tax=Glomus cerebriforme TaxID=658196 RepID=A0A397T262_9GLOM|nr:BTB/POZ protein [Glomus cerebriforme]
MAKEGCWNRSQMKELKKVITEIYEVMDKISELEDQKMLIKLKTKKPNKKIFLNGGDPFDEKNWVAGKDLVFGIQEDIEEMYKVNDYLKEYKDLLMLAGASEIDPPPPPTPVPIFDQKNKLVKTLLDKFERQSNEYHDVTFIVGEEKICANRYVLSAASTYFEKMFFGGLSESARNKIEIKINDIQPNIFRVLVRWLYGQSFEDAINSVLCKRDDFTTEQESYESYYLLHLVKLLKVTDFYGVELKSKVEDTIIQYIAVNNVCDVLAWSKESKATRLKDYCKEYIKSNKELVTKLHEDANERLKISRF